MKDDDKVLLNRREVLKLTAAGACIPCLLPLLSGCGTTTGSSLSGKVDINLDDPQYATLKNDGGVVELSTDQTGASHPIFVVRKGGSYLALSAECPHAGCDVYSNGSQGFQCPCHGATFKIDGTVTGGPAPTNLYKYNTKLNGHVLTIG